MCAELPTYTSTMDSMDNTENFPKFSRWKFPGKIRIQCFVGIRQSQVRSVTLLKSISTYFENMGILRNSLFIEVLKGRARLFWLNMTELRIRIEIDRIRTLKKENRIFILIRIRITRNPGSENKRFQIRPLNTGSGCLDLIQMRVCRSYPDPGV